MIESSLMDQFALRRINLSKKGRIFLLFKTTSKKRQKADVEDRELAIADAPRASYAHPGYPIQGCRTPGGFVADIVERG